MDKKLEDCHFFVVGHCSKGNGCEFRHMEEIKGNPICVKWLLEKCHNTKCPNRHPTLPRQKDGTRTLCFYNQACTRSDCTFFHTGTTTSPATARPDSETPLTKPLQPRDPQTKSAVAVASTAVTPAVPTILPPRLEASKPIRPQQKKAKDAVPDLMPPRGGQHRLNGNDLSGGGEGKAAPSGKTFVKSFQEIMKEKEKETSASKDNTQPQQKAPDTKVKVNNKAAAAQRPGGANKTKQEDSQRGQIPTENNAKNGPHRKVGSQKVTGKQPPPAAVQTAAEQKKPPTRNSSTTTPTAASSRPSFGVSLGKLLQERQAEAASKALPTAAVAPTPTASGGKRAREDPPATAKAVEQRKQKQQRRIPATAAQPATAASDEGQQDFDIEQELAQIPESELADPNNIPLDDDLLLGLLDE